MVARNRPPRSNHGTTGCASLRVTVKIVSFAVGQYMRRSQTLTAYDAPSIMVLFVNERQFMSVRVFTGGYAERFGDQV